MSLPIRRRTAAAARALFAWAALALAACSSLGSGYGDVERSEAPAVLADAEARLAAGETVPALHRLVSLHRVQGLAPDLRGRVEARLTEVTERAIAERTGPEHDPDELVDVYKLELPARLKALAGVRAAEQYLLQGRRVKAYRTIRKVEERVPAHYERALAADVLWGAGSSLCADGGRYGLFLSFRARGVEALEFLVLNYPSSPHCAAAYETLARIYEDRRDYDAAIERYEDLLVYHLSSPEAVRGEARLPWLRLRRLTQDDYDRGQLLLAAAELRRWRERHEGASGDPELEAWVRDVEVTAGARLAASDLSLARYYARIDNAFGARSHAERARVEAEGVGAEDLARAARDLLAELGPAPATMGPAPPPASAPADAGEAGS